MLDRDILTAADFDKVVGVLDYDVQIADADAQAFTQVKFICKAKVDGSDAAALEAEGRQI